MPCVPQLASRLRQCDSHEVISEVEACSPFHYRAERFFICSLNVYVRKEPLQILPQSDLVDAAVRLAINIRLPYEMRPLA